MNPLPAELPIQPFSRPARGEVRIPGSKSLTNRALLLAALCEKPVTITGALFSEDTTIMAQALRDLGVTVQAEEVSDTMRVADQIRRRAVGDAVLQVGLAGTAARFLTALCASSSHGIFRIDGVPQMRRRPMQPLLDSLRGLGANIRCRAEEGFLPVDIRAHGLSGGRVQLDASESSQLLSALLMVAPLASAPVEIEIVGDVRESFVRMTAQLMTQFGQPPLPADPGRIWRVIPGHPYTLPGGTYAIEPDATTASYFLALPLVTGGQVTIRGLTGSGSGLQGDARFATVLGESGLNLSVSSQGVSAEFDLTRHRHGLEKDFHEISDTFLTLAAITPLLSGPTKITGIAHTRKQETDRVAGMARELTRLGQHVVETEDTLEIDPRPLRSGVTVETYGDHRFAMSFAILGCHDLHGDGQPWLTVRDPACCKKTFPKFFSVLSALREVSHSV